MKSPQEQHHVVCIIIIRTFLYHVLIYPLEALLVLFQRYKSGDKATFMTKTGRERKGGTVCLKIALPV